jgi:hypothetical protein
MEKIMNYHNLRSFAYVNDTICKKPVKGIVISFFGLGGMTMYDNDFMEGEFYAEKGIVYVVPYNNPWAWMNNQAVKYTDEIIDVLIEKYNLDDNIPIVSIGESMGGQSALVYTAKAKRTPVACVANCPVCDVVYHFTERNDLPRTLYSSLFNEAGSLEDALKRISPLHLIDKMPKVKYHIFHCDEDMAVNIDAHSKKLIAEFDKRKYDFTFDVIEKRGHCDLTLEMKRKFAEYVINAVEQ